MLLDIAGGRVYHHRRWGCSTTWECTGFAIRGHGFKSHHLHHYDKEVNADARSTGESPAPLAVPALRLRLGAAGRQARVLPRMPQAAEGVADEQALVPPARNRLADTHLAIHLPRR